MKLHNFIFKKEQKKAQWKFQVVALSTLTLQMGNRKVEIRSSVTTCNCVKNIPKDTRKDT